MNRIAAAALALLLAVPVHPGVVATPQGPDETDVAYGAIQEGLSRSSEIYLAGVVEAAAEARCQGEGNQRRCTYPANIVQVMASEIVGEGETLRIAGEVEVGKRVMGFFIPSESGKTWSATYLSFDTGGTKQAQFEKALRMAGLIAP